MGALQSCFSSPLERLEGIVKAQQTSIKALERRARAAEARAARAEAALLDLGSAGAALICLLYTSPSPRD